MDQIYRYILSDLLRFYNNVVASYYDLWMSLHFLWSQRERRLDVTERDN